MARFRRRRTVRGRNRRRSGGYSRRRGRAGRTRGLRIGYRF